MLPGERVPRVAGELTEERALRPPVALAERVQCVDLMYCGRQNMAPLAMATVRICPAQS
jgi:hypothetical protein